jgi:hypothetical protein
MDPRTLEPDRAGPLEVLQGALHDFTDRTHHRRNLLVGYASTGFWSALDNMIMAPGTAEQEARHPRHDVPACKVFDGMAQ